MDMSVRLLPAPAWAPQVGLIRSLSASSGVTHHSLAMRFPWAQTGTVIVSLEGRRALGKLLDQVDYVIGVDTHKNSHTAAAVDTHGGARAHLTVPTDAFGNRKLLHFGREHGLGRRVWAIEGTGSFGAGLTTFLLERGEWVVEIDRPSRASRRSGAKSDQLDAVRAAREALARDHLAQPRQRGSREAMRVLLTTREGAMVSRTRAICHLKSLVVNSHQALRDQLRHSPLPSSS